VKVEVRMRNIHPSMMRAIMGRNGTQAKVKMKDSGTMLKGLTNIDIF
jgi:folate-dependent phosphoribosylglycinamide formyltransferase PurN